MRSRLFLLLLAAAAVICPGTLLVAAPALAQSAGSSMPSLALQGLLKHPQSIDLAALRRLPSETVRVQYETEHGDVVNATFTGVRLWTLLQAAGGLADDARGADVRHMIRVTAGDAYVAVLSTGEIAPDFGAKPALIAYQRDGALLAGKGYYLVMPGDKRDSRYVSDVVSINVE